MLILSQYTSHVDCVRHCLASWVKARQGIAHLVGSLVIDIVT